MGPPTLLGERRVAGSLLVSGFAVLVVAAFLYGDGDYPAGQTWQSNALTVGLVLTLLGLTAFQVVLTDSGDRLLAQLGTSRLPSTWRRNVTLPGGTASTLVSPCAVCAVVHVR